MIQQELALNLKKALGFRNMAVHNYAAIDWRIVHDIAKNHLDAFSEFAKAIALTLNDAP